jgi:hypothetical protein
MLLFFFDPLVRVLTWLGLSSVHRELMRTPRRRSAHPVTIA